MSLLLVLTGMMLACVNCGGGGGNDPSTTNFSYVSRADIWVDVDLNQAEHNFVDFTINVDQVYWHEFKDTTKLLDVRTDKITVDKGKKYILEINGKSKDRWIISDLGLNYHLLDGVRIKVILNNYDYWIEVKDLTWRLNDQGGYNAAIYFTTDGQNLTWEKYPLAVNAPVYNFTDVSVIVDFNKASNVFSAFYVNVESLFWQEYKNFKFIQTDEITVEKGKKNLLEFNGQTLDGIWIVDGQKINFELLQGVVFEVMLHDQVYVLKSEDLAWRSNNQGGGNAAIYFIYDGEKIVFEKFTGPPPQDNTAQIVVKADFSQGTHNFVLFMVNIPDLYWQDFKDNTKLTNIQTAEITVEKDKKYLLEFNGQSDIWLADDQVVHYDYLDKVVIGLDLKGQTYLINNNNLTWRSNGQGGGNAAIYFTFDGEKIVFEKY